MGLMQKLRSSTKYMIWILILSFGLLWVLADTQVFDAMMAGPRNMAEVDGDPITYAEFNQRINLFTEQHRQQTGASPDTETRAQYEEMAFEQLVTDKVLSRKMEQMGITVTDTELIDMVTGENPDPFIRQQFMREDGTIDRTALRNAIDAPENREIWILIEQQLREQRRQQKLNQYMESALRVSDFEIEQQFVRQNSRATFEYVRFPYAEVTADEVEVSEAEIRQFYNDQSHRFQREKSWRISYVSFSIAPTERDTARTIQGLANLRTEFEQTEEVREFLTDNFSETRYFANFLRPNEVRVEHLPAFDLSIGEVSEPYLHAGRGHMIRLLEDRPAGETFTRVRKIRVATSQQAESALERIRGGEAFSSVARSVSNHAASAREGGELGYIARGSRPAPRANAIFNASIGSLIGPLEDDDGFFIYEIVARTNRDIRFADLSRDVEADAFDTVQRLANEAEDFQYFAESDGFESEAERSGFTVEQALATEGNPFIPGLGQSRIILNELAPMRRGRVSDVIETEDRFIVLRVDEVIPAGARPLEEVRAQVESLVRDRKRRDVAVQRVQERLSAGITLEDLASQNGKSVQTAERIRLNAATIPGAGREPKVVGAAFSLQQGVVSPVIAGNNAAFVIVVQERVMADSSDLTTAERREIRNQLQQQKNMSFQSVWIDRIKADANVRDFRVQQRLMAPQAPPM